MEGVVLHSPGKTDFAQNEVLIRGLFQQRNQNRIAAEPESPPSSEPLCVVRSKHAHNKRRFYFVLTRPCRPSLCPCPASISGSGYPSCLSSEGP